MNRLPISVCIIAAAEEQRIPKALASVSGWVQEIIVVLNEDVRDRTEAICLEHGARVFREPWKGHIAQKNSALDKATQPWVLGLDADEEVSPPLQKSIEEALAAPGDHAAFCFPRRTCFCGRWILHGDWYPDHQTRLWRRGQARWGGVDPHDRLLVEGSIGRLRADLFHYNAETIDRQIAKISSYSNDFARHAASRQRPARWLDLAVRPFWRFLRCYVVRRGFLDGWQGYYIAWMTAFYTATRYAKVRAAGDEAKPMDR